MTLNELENKYAKIPDVLKNEKRWIMYRLVHTNDRVDKQPFNAINNCLARSNDSNTWTTFNLAIRGCVKYNADGLGFMFGNGFFGIDLDNHIDKETGKAPMTDEEFAKLANEFIGSLNSYAEHSQSGRGIHIICKGSLPAGRRRKGNVEMYDSVRFFATTGNVYGDQTEIRDCTSSIVPLWQKYVDVPIVQQVTKYDIPSDYVPLSDYEVVNAIMHSKDTNLINLYNRSIQGPGDESRNDGALMASLAWWCNKNIEQMISIFSRSPYCNGKDDFHKKKWFEREDYRMFQANNAVNLVQGGFTPSKKEETPIIIKTKRDNGPASDNNGEITNRKVEFENDYTDSGNAKNFVLLFGDDIHYNEDNKVFMNYDGEKWYADSTESIALKKKVDIFINVLKDRGNTKFQDWSKSIESSSDPEDIKESKRDNLETSKAAYYKNITRISNHAGKEAMIKEIYSVGNIPIKNDKIDSDNYALNTKSGLVNLKTGEITPHNRNQLVTFITSCEVSYETPQKWLEFLHSIWFNANITETEVQEKIDFFQKWCGYALSGVTYIEKFPILYGNGSNGKSVVVGVLTDIFGNYCKPIDTKMVVGDNKNIGINIENAYAELKGCRLAIANETEKHSNLNTSFMKKAVTHNEAMKGRFLFGNTFYFYPTHHILVSTNYLPIITETDDGTWRRPQFIDFPNKFIDGLNSDPFLNEKLKEERAKILGWMIGGAKKVFVENLVTPECIARNNKAYRTEMDSITNYIKENCEQCDGYKTSIKKMFEDYRTWARENNEKNILSQREFDSEIIRKGYQKTRMAKGMFYIGLKMVHDNIGVSFSELVAKEDVKK